MRKRRRKSASLSGSPESHRYKAEGYAAQAAHYANRTANAKSCDAALDAYTSAAEAHGQFLAHAEEADKGGQRYRGPRKLIKDDIRAAAGYVAAACRRNK